jgi:glucan phosphoethanolaminetransferase (alkaline phosphatase superfamily)
MEWLKRNKNLIFFHIALNCAVVLFITGASYYHTPLEGGKDTLVYLGHLFLLQTTIAGFIYILSLYKWVFRIVFSGLFIFFCSFSFFGYTQDISVTPGLIQAVFETTPDIAIDLITVPYAAFLVTAILVLVFFIKWHSRLKTSRSIFLFGVLAAGCIALFFITEMKRLNTLKSRLPYNVFTGVEDYYSAPKFQLNKALPNVTKQTDSLTIIFVLGETVRADHLGLNGYSRNTTPLLSKQEIISYPNIYTSNTYTGASIPQLLTDKKLDVDKESYTSIYDVANAAGYETSWIGNQTLEKSFAPIVNTNEHVILVDKYKSEYSFNKELDEAMLPAFDNLLGTNNNQLITLHMMGSHWYYENRYPENLRKYTPVITSKYIPSLTTEEIVNSYDNTILYLDYFLNEVIERAKKNPVPTVVFYVSDHGESLGEKGQYLHAGDAKEQTNPALLFWMSDSFKKKHSGKAVSISEARNVDLTTDMVFDYLRFILTGQQ